MENISAAKIQQYIQGISGKSDCSVRAWQEWAALEKYLKPQTVAILQKVCFVLALLRKSGMDFECVCACVKRGCLHATINCSIDKLKWGQTEPAQLACLQILDSFFDW